LLLTASASGQASIHNGHSGLYILQILQMFTSTVSGTYSWV